MIVKQKENIVDKQTEQFYKLTEFYNILGLAKKNIEQASQSIEFHDIELYRNKAIWYLRKALSWIETNKEYLNMNDIKIDHLKKDIINKIKILESIKITKEDYKAQEKAKGFAEQYNSYYSRTPIKQNLYYEELKQLTNIEKIKQTLNKIEAIKEEFIEPLYKFSYSYRTNSLKGIKKSQSFISYKLYKELGGKKNIFEYKNLEYEEKLRVINPSLTIDTLIESYLNREKLSFNIIAISLAIDLIPYLGEIKKAKIIAKNLEKEVLEGSVKLLDNLIPKVEELITKRLEDKYKKGLLKIESKEEIKLIAKKIVGEYKRAIEELRYVYKELIAGRKELALGKDSWRTRAYLNYEEKIELLEKIGIKKEDAKRLALLSISSEMKKYTIVGHQKRTAELFKDLAKDVGLEVDERVINAIYIHDTGKAILPKRALRAQKDSVIHQLDIGHMKSGVPISIYESIGIMHERLGIEILEKIELPNELKQKIRVGLFHHGRAGSKASRVFKKVEHGSTVRGLLLFSDSFDAALSPRAYNRTVNGLLKKGKTRREIIELTKQKTEQTIENLLKENETNSYNKFIIKHVGYDRLKQSIINIYESKYKKKIEKIIGNKKELEKTISWLKEQYRDIEHIDILFEALIKGYKESKGYKKAAYAYALNILLK